MTDTPDSMDRAIDALSTSCLRRARQGDRDAWLRLERTHRPLVCWWCLKGHVPGQDVDDVAQEVFSSLATGDAQMRSADFRGLLWTITRTRILDYWRSQAKRPPIVDGPAIEQLLDEVAAVSSRSTEGGIDQATRLVFDAIVQEVKGHFSDTDWRAFWQTAVDERKAADVARELQITCNQVYLARSRILRHIRTAFAENTVQADP